MQFKNQRSGGKTVWPFYCFYSERNYDKKSKSKEPMSKNPCFLLNKNNLKRRNRKCEILHRILGRLTLCFSSYKNCKLKVKLWWTGVGKKKKTKKKKKKKKKIAHFLRCLFSAQGIFLTFVFYLNVYCIK